MPTFILVTFLFLSDKRLYSCLRPEFMVKEVFSYAFTVLQYLCFLNSRWVNLLHEFGS